MNSGVRKTGGRIVLECLLAVAIAAFAPVIVMSQLLSVSMVIMMPAIGYVFLKNYAGKAIAAISGILMLVFSALLLDASVMWMMFAMNIIPQMVINAVEKKAFGSRMVATVIAFLLGAVGAVVVIYISFGGNMIERFLGGLPNLLREVPEESLAGMIETLSVILNMEIASVDALHLLFEESIQKLIPLYQLNMPGMLLSGAVVSAVICVWLDGWMKARRGNADKGQYIPVHEWYLPSSTTGGLVLIFVVSLIMNYAGIQQGQAVFATVFHLAVAAFCVQGFASVRRKFCKSPRKALGIVFSLGYLAVALIGAGPYLALYGLASAIFGSGGVMKQRIDAKNGRYESETHIDEDKDEDKGE